MRSRLKFMVPIGASILLLCLTVSSCQQEGGEPALRPEPEAAPQGTIMLDDDDEDPTSGPEPQDLIGPEEEKEEPTNN